MNSMVKINPFSSVACTLLNCHIIVSLVAQKEMFAKALMLVFHMDAKGLRGFLHENRAQKTAF